MMRRHPPIGALGLALIGLLLPAWASAQSAFSGIVRDTTGAVMPGVTVEAASDVLIEKVRTAVSDDQGRYAIVDLRPGSYTVTFTLPGFSTFKRDAVELPANFTATINAELRVGEIEETVTVTGASPVVDVKSTQKTTVLSRDSLPTGRNYAGLASLMPGVRMSNTDVGGNQQMEQIYMTVHGSRQTDTTLQVDGMSLNSLMNDGQVQAYYSDAANAEVSYQTSGVGADVSGGGVRINMIPKEGGNRLSGSAFFGGTDGSWQGSNVTDELRARGLQQGSKVDLISDFNVALGGPVKRDRLWFFATWRRIATNSIIANNFYKDGRPGIEDQWIQNQMVRLTWQVNEKNKFTIYHDRYPKFKGHEMGALTDPDTAARRRNPENALYYTAQAKWTSTLTSRLLLEGGFSTNNEYYTGKYQPGVEKPRGSPEWYTTIGKNDLVLLTNYDGTVTPSNATDPKKWVASTSASYVTGTHSFKTGIQWGFGDYVIDRDINGDLVQLYRNGRPDSVRIYNTPIRSHEFLNADLGVYAQDSWTLNRLTLNAGVRFEYFNGKIEAQDIAAGRFAPTRHFDEVPDFPNWFDVAPRLGAAYDLFGNARTALKVTFSKYMAGQTLGFPQRYNPLQLQSDTRTWSDLNGDNVAQENEIGPTTNLSFGLPVLAVRPDPNIKREHDLEYTAGVQHELVRGVSVSGAWYRRGTYNMRRTDTTRFNRSNYTVVNVVSPLDGSIIPAYNLDPLKNQLDRVDSNSTDPNLRRMTYNGVEFGATARFKGGSLFGGWTFDRRIVVHCDELENWGNYPINAFVNPLTLNSNQPKSDFHYCDQSQLGLPWLHEFKLSGTYLLPWWGIQANAALQSYAGAPLATRWSIGRTTRYAANCLGPCTPGALVIPNMTPTTYVLDLVPPGGAYYGRLNQLDVGIRKIFRIQKYQFSAQADIFNVANVSYVKSQNVTLGSSFGQPLDVLQPRLLRLAMQMKF
jgi:Carboxypeptidase regulatory-like domain